MSVNYRHAGAAARLRITGGAPAAVPALLDFLDVAPIALGGTPMLDAARGLAGHAVLLRGQCAQAQALGGFFIQLLGHGGPPAQAAQTSNHDGAADRALSKGDGVAQLDLARRLGVLPVDLDAALADFVGGQRSGLVKARGPEPFVQSKFFAHGSPCYGSPCRAAARRRRANIRAWTKPTSGPR